MHKLLCIVGPTGTGKTAKAIELATEQPSVIISADSRQVYRGMDIVTGKDHPKEIEIFGIDIVDPDEPCSVAVWYDSVIPLIIQAWKNKKQVLVVGGTGLYVKAILGGIDTMKVPIDQSLRDALKPLSISELQTKLNALNVIKFKSMNHSDSLNPRRLIRAIEVAMSKRAPLKSKIYNLESKIIGLKYFNDSNYRSKIKDRVISRVKAGAIEETKLLLSKYDKSLQSLSAIGYKSIIGFLDGKLSEDEMIESWVSGEVAYAKRQMTWFRKQPVIWYDVDINKEN